MSNYFYIFATKSIYIFLSLWDLHCWALWRRFVILVELKIKCWIDSKSLFSSLVSLQRRTSTSEQALTRTNRTLAGQLGRQLCRVDHHSGGLSTVYTEISVALSRLLSVCHAWQDNSDHRQASPSLWCWAVSDVLGVQQVYLQQAICDGRNFRKPKL